MNAKRDIIEEIQEIRRRTGPSDWDNGITKMSLLWLSLDRLNHESEEQSYFLVASIAAMEVYFRWEIRRLIESGGVKYIENFQPEELLVRVDRDLLVAVHGRKVSIGELIAHTAKLGNLETINRTMGKILGTDFLDLIKNARDPEERREKGENASLVVGSLSKTLANVKRTFFLRHIICHEAHLNVGPKLDEIKELCASCYEFARASSYAIAYYENPNAPLTLDEARKAASERVKILVIQMKELEDLVVSQVRDPLMENAFNSMQEAWKIAVQKQADFDASHHMNGNRGALYEQLTIEDLYKKRIAETKEYAENLGKAERVI